MGRMLSHRPKALPAGDGWRGGKPTQVLLGYMLGWAHVEAGFQVFS